MNSISVFLARAAEKQRNSFIHIHHFLRGGTFIAIVISNKNRCHPFLYRAEGRRKYG